MAEKKADVLCTSDFFFHPTGEGWTHNTAYNHSNTYLHYNLIITINPSFDFGLFADRF